MRLIATPPHVSRRIRALLVVAGAAFTLNSRLGVAGEPGAILAVRSQQGHCPTAAKPLKGKSWVAGNKGSLQFDIALPGVQGVPGTPADVVLHYASGSDNHGTYGAPDGGLDQQASAAV